MAQDIPAVTFHGQYRINSWVLRGEDGVETSASRLRARPTFDVALPEETALHLQFNIGHINANALQATVAHDGGPSFGLRQLVVSRAWDKALVLEAGLVPLSDRFGDTLFSADWDFSPLAAGVRGESGGLSWRAAAGRVVEGSEAWDAKDNATILIGDVDYGPFGASVYGLLLGQGASAAPTLQEGDLTIAGLRYQDDLGPLNLRLNLMASHLSGQVADTEVSATGFAFIAAAQAPVGESLKLGLLSSVTTGDTDFGQAKDSGAFLTPLSLLGLHGYWGYTGKLTVQGPTDTGIDDPVNIDGGSYGNQNLGRGLLTVQGKGELTLAEFARLYVGAGFFRGVSDGGLQSKDIGVDVYAQVRWTLGAWFTLETGVDVASLGEGYHGASETGRQLLVLGFSRLQLEY
jgi:hypothetical protein